VLGRIGPGDELSQDGHYWRKFDELPELAAAVDQLVKASSGNAADDPQWRDDRIKASLRWLDERKSPDRREHESPQSAAMAAPLRSGGDRRITPETVEQHAYRESRTSTESGLQQHRQHYGKGLLLGVTIALAALVGVTTYRPVNPVKVGLFIRSADCSRPPQPNINWEGCDKSGYLLVGGDLSGASLTRVKFVGANLAHTDFSGALLEGADLRKAVLQYAHLSNAQLQGADLRGALLDGAEMAGAELGNAIWIDGRICKRGSKGRCY